MLLLLPYEDEIKTLSSMQASMNRHEVIDFVPSKIIVNMVHCEIIVKFGDSMQQVKLHEVLQV